MNKPDNSSDRKQYPGTALAGEPRYRNIVNNARIGIGDVSVDGTIIYANPTALKMFEFDSLDDMREINIIDLWHRPEQRDEFISKLRQDGYVNNYEIEYLTRTGTVFTVLGSAMGPGENGRSPSRACRSGTLQHGAVRDWSRTRCALR